MTLVKLKCSAGNHCSLLQIVPPIWKFANIGLVFRIEQIFTTASKNNAQFKSSRNQLNSKINNRFVNLNPWHTLMTISLFFPGAIITRKESCFTDFTTMETGNSDWRIEQAPTVTRSACKHPPHSTCIWKRLIFRSRSLDQHLTHSSATKLTKISAETIASSF